jgi:hypothetical protein
MKLVSYFFFYTYVGLIILAGFWGAFMNVNVDFQLLFNMNPQILPDGLRVDLISQYRFLRAIELGFGAFSIIFAKNIFSEKKFNMLFLFIMASGVLARIVSIVVEGIPNNLMLFFLIYELTGVCVIFLYSRTRVYQNAGN